MEQYYLRDRYYNPVVGRFLQEDTYRGDGLNLYAYCANNPVVYYDPSGHDGCDKTTQANSGKNPSNNIITDPARLLETTKNLKIIILFQLSEGKVSHMLILFAH